MIQLPKQADRKPRRRIQCVDTGEIFPDAYALSEKIGVYTQQVYNSIRLQKPLKGKTYIYIDPMIRAYTQDAQKDI